MECESSAVSNKLNYFSPFKASKAVAIGYETQSVVNADYNFNGTLPTVSCLPVEIQRPVSSVKPEKVKARILIHREVFFEYLLEPFKIFPNFSLPLAR